jgi:integrase
LELIRCAHELSSPSFAGWLQVAAFTGLRPGELDALRRANVDLDRGRIRVVEQFNAKTRTFTPPKNGLAREAPLTEPAREAIVALPVDPWRALVRQLPCVPLEGHQGRGRVERQPLSGHPSFCGLVHGQRP